MVEPVTKYPNIRTIGKAILITIAFLIGGLVAAFIILIITLITTIIYIGAKRGNIQQVNDIMISSFSTLWVNVPYIVLQNIFAIIIVLLFIVLIDRKKSPLIVLRLRPVKGVLKFFFTGVFLIIPISFGIIACLLVTGLTTFDATGFSRYSTASLVISFSSFFIATILTAFGEEMVFRGYIQPLLTNRYGITAGLIGASVIFAIPHLINGVLLMPMLGVFLGGLIMGYLVIKTGSLYTSIGFHFLWNFLIIDVFQIGTPIVDLGAYPLFLFSMPPDFVIGGMNLGRSDELVQVIVLMVFLLTLYVYYKIHKSQPTGIAIEKS